MATSPVCQLTNQILRLHTKSAIFRPSPKAPPENNLFLNLRGSWHSFNMLSKWLVILAVSPVILFGLGLDLAKATLLVSAVSVGIGFGLQEIFSQRRATHSLHQHVQLYLAAKDCLNILNIGSGRAGETSCPQDITLRPRRRASGCSALIQPAAGEKRKSRTTRACNFRTYQRPSRSVWDR